MQIKFRSRVQLIMLAAYFVFSSCGNGNSPALDTPTSGTINITVDETFKPIIDSEINVFQSLYKNAHIKVHYLPEADCFKELMNDSSRVILVTRNLSATEKKYFNDQKYFPTETPIAKDGIAVILNNKNTDTLLNYFQLEKILKGEINVWKMVSSTSNLNKIQIVFDNAKSSTLRFIKDSIIKNTALPENIFAAKTNEEVIDYVSKNENAIGFVGSNWCKDLNDSIGLLFTKRVKVAGIDPPKKVDVDFPQPLQSYIALKYYPLSRQIFTISREPRVGLGTGFVNFLASDIGQRIILKGGLLPQTMPMRIVSVKKSF